jgi:hypothetical protein
MARPRALALVSALAAVFVACGSQGGSGAAGQACCRLQAGCFCPAEKCSSGLAPSDAGQCGSDDSGGPPFMTCTVRDASRVCPGDSGCAYVCVFVDGTSQTVCGGGNYVSSCN